MKSRFLLFILALIVLIPSRTDAQKWKLKRYEAVFGVGFLNYFGDIGGSAEQDNWFGLKDLSIKSTRPSFYLGARYKIRSNVSVKMNLMYGYITGSDEGSKNSDRGYEFTSSIFEPSVQLEYSIISEEQRYRSSALFNKRGMINNFSQINLYLFAGIGGVFYNPKVNDAMSSGASYELGHSTAGIVFPAGIGLKYVISSNWSFGAELGVRWTTTDYMDGYTSQWSNANDLYYFGVINGVYRIQTSRKGAPVFFKNRRRSFM